MRKQEANSTAKETCVDTAFTSSELHSLASGINSAQGSFCSEGKHLFDYIIAKIHTYYLAIRVKARISALKMYLEHVKHKSSGRYCSQIFEYSLANELKGIRIHSLHST